MSRRRRELIAAKRAGCFGETVPSIEDFPSFENEPSFEDEPSFIDLPDWGDPEDDDGE